MKDFLLICDKNCATYKEVFPLFKQGIVSFGSPVKEYDGTDRKFGNHGWITTFPVANKKKLILTATYDPELYPKYDNYDAIEVSRIKNIPYDYDGVMGVPITILDYDLDNVEIVDLSRYQQDSSGMSKEFVDEYYRQGNTGQICEGHPDLCFYDKGKAVVPYMRVLIKKNFEVEGLFGNFKETDCNETTGFVSGEDVSAYNLPGTQNGPVIITSKGPEAKYKRILIKKNYSPEQFELLGIQDRDDEFRTKVYTTAEYEKASDMNRAGVIILDGKVITPYRRLFIRRKK